VNQSRPRVTLDGIGTVLSTTCAIHCLITPLLVASASLGALGWLAGETTEFTLLSLAMILAAVVLGWGWHVHCRSAPLCLFASAMVLIGAGRLLVPEVAETPLVVSGGALIALAHIVNARLHRLCSTCQKASGEEPLPESPQGMTRIDAGPATRPRLAP
jgi:MerC mercury resistance protein